LNINFSHAGEFYSTLCALLWAIGVLLFKKSGERVAPVPLNMFKDTVALLLFAISMLVAGVPLYPAGTTSSDVIVLAISGVLGIGIADSLFFASLNRLGAGRSAIVDCLYSPFIILGSFLYLHEPIGPAVLLGMLLMIAAILTGVWNPERGENERARRSIHLGALLGMFSMALMAVGIVMAKPVLDRSDPLWATTVRLAGGWIFLFLQCSRKRYRAQALACFRPSRDWSYTVSSAVVGSYLAMFFWVAGMKYTYTTLASVLNQLSTIFVVMLSAVFLREPLTWRRLLAMVLGFGGAVIAIVGLGN